uniref:Beta-defensin-like domain-containing protein n=1 Tax=Strigops habroptila TaxID=2489341 RepID=A0A672UJE7_STRHB
MGILWFMLIFISLMGHGDAQGPSSCKHEGGPCSCKQQRGLCRLGSCEPGEYLGGYCFEPIILCCKILTPPSAKS